MTDILQYSFFQNALIIGILSSIVCGIIGSYVVVKRMSFISGSIAHTAFGGLGLSLFIGCSPLLGALGFGLGSSLLMGVIRFKFKQQEDALIGTIWAVGMSIGALCISLSKSYSGDMFGYLFGSILLTSNVDILIVSALALTIITGVFLLYRPLQAITFDEDYAKILNLPVFRLYLFLLGLIACTVIILLKTVGSILVMALLTLPAATSKNLHNRLHIIMITATILGCISSVGGLLIAAYTNLPPGPIIIFIATGLYLTSLLKKSN